MTVEPFTRTLGVTWGREEAFRRFTHDIALWWPIRTVSAGGDKVRRVILEEKPGGEVYEVHRDGRRVHWGWVTTWDPPGRLVLTWDPPGDTPRQEVTLTFTDDNGRADVELVSSGWDDANEEARREENASWAEVLDAYAARRTYAFVVFLMIVGVAALALKASRRASRE